SGSLDRTVKVWDARTGQEVLALKGHTSPVHSVAFSPDGKRLTTTDVVRTLGWDAQTGKRLPGTFKPPDTRDPAVSSDGRLLARIDGNVVRLIDLRLSDDELACRRWVTRIDLAWHAAEAARHAQAGQWFAGAFHHQRALTGHPQNADLRRGLALCQLGV